MARFRATDLAVDTKPDLTLVTEGDRAVEEMVRERLARDRPGDAIVGEEFGSSGSGPRRWVVDPIDGTSGYARGIPVWATLLALEREGGLEVGVISAPALHARWWGTLEDGAFRDGSRVRVSGVAALADAHLAISFARPAVHRAAWSLAVAARTRAIRARFSTSQWLAPASSRRPESAAEMPRTRSGEGDIGVS